MLCWTCESFCSIFFVRESLMRWKFWCYVEWFHQQRLWFRQMSKKRTSIRITSSNQYDCSNQIIRCVRHLVELIWIEIMNINLSKNLSIHSMSYSRWMKFWCFFQHYFCKKFRKWVQASRWKNIKQKIFTTSFRL